MSQGVPAPQADFEQLWIALNPKLALSLTRRLSTKSALGSTPSLCRCCPNVGPNRPNPSWVRPMLCPSESDFRKTWGDFGMSSRRTCAVLGPARHAPPDDGHLLPVAHALWGTTRLVLKCSALVSSLVCSHVSLLILPLPMRLSPSAAVRWLAAHHSLSSADEEPAFHSHFESGAEACPLVVSEILGGGGALFAANSTLFFTSSSEALLLLASLTSPNCAAQACPPLSLQFACGEPCARPVFVFSHLSVTCIPPAPCRPMCAEC